ncbi:MULTISPECIES: chaplin [unclassified Streptomyces]|uniref:chaplin n=1 Tax=unclassified Streptomyces TaxID=2593676 RepID=UPI004041D7B8
MKRVTRNSVIAIAVASGAMAVAGTAHADSAADGAANGSPGVLSGNNVQAPVNVPVNVCGNTVDVVGLLNPAMGNRCANTGHASTGKAGSATSGTAGSTASHPSGSHRTGSHETGRHETGRHETGWHETGWHVTGQHKGGGHKSGGNRAGSGTPGSMTSGGAEAVGVAHDSPGLISGNGLGLPFDLPLNLSGNTVDVVSALNPVFGNESVNGSDDSDQPVRSTPRTHRPHTPAKAHPRPARSTTVVTPSTATLAHTGTSPWVPAGVSLAFVTAGAVLYRRFRPTA